MVSPLVWRRPGQAGQDGVDAATFDHSIPLQRIWEWPTRLFVNEALAQFIWDRDLEGAELTPVALV
jgi:hypothetical protein